MLSLCSRARAAFFCAKIVVGSPAAAAQQAVDYIVSTYDTYGCYLVRAGKSVKGTITDCPPNHMDGWVYGWIHGMVAQWQQRLCSYHTLAYCCCMWGSHAQRFFSQVLVLCACMLPAETMPGLPVALIEDVDLLLAARTRSCIAIWQKV